MRVYVGLTHAALKAARDNGVIDAPLTAHAVTPALREHYATADAEELEYAALMAAAESCLPMLAADPGERRRRFVAACETEHAMNDPQPGPSGVAIAEPIPWRDVQALHADDPEAASVISAAATAYAAAQAGDDDARFTVDEADAWELMWFATQEVDDLLGS